MAFSTGLQLLQVTLECNQSLSAFLGKLGPTLVAQNLF